MKRWFFMCLAASMLQMSLQHCNVEIFPKGDEATCAGVIICDDCSNDNMQNLFNIECSKTLVRGRSRLHYEDYHEYESYDESYSSSLKIIGHAHDCGYVSIESFIHSIDLSSNDLTTIPEFSLNQNLKTLNLSRNLITEISSNFQYFQSVDLSYNEVSKLNLEASWGPDHLKNFNLSHNEINFISPNFFRDSVIESLNLSHNKLFNLNDQAWTASLITLDLSHNDLNEIKFTSSLPRLSQINLSQNHISNFCLEDLNFDNLQFIDLSFNKIMIIECSFNHRNLKTLNLSNNFITNFKNGFDSEALSMIDLSNNEIFELKSKTFKKTNLSSFLIGNNILKGRLSKGMLLGLKYVSELDLYGQNIVAIDDYAFFGAFNIEYFNCSWNNIYNISYLAFRSLNKLETLDLSRNKISNIDFDKSDLLQLKWLSMRNNKITTITNKTFEDIVSLVYLDISINEIFDLQSDSFSTLQHLHTLTLTENPLGHILRRRSFSGLRSLSELSIVSTNISQIENVSFNGMVQAQRLNLSNNKLCKLDYNSFVGINALLVLDLSSNFLTELDINVTSIRKLEILYLNRNQIKSFIGEEALPYLSKLSVSRNSFHELPKASSLFRNITYLDISFNPMTNICLDFTQLYMLKSLIMKGTKQRDFKNCLSIKNLQILNFQFSEIFLVSNLAIPVFSSLQIFDLSNNVIQNISRYDFDKTTNIKTLDLYNNSIHELEPGAFLNLIYLRSLNISKNNIKFIKFGTFSGLAQLEFLDLSFNNINILNPHLFHFMPTLKELYVDHNILADLDFVYSLDETNVRQVSIGSNFIPCAEIVKLKKMFISKDFLLTTTNNEIHTENVDGITCHSGMSSNKFIPVQNGSKFGSNQLEFLRLLNELLIKVKEMKGQKDGNMEINQTSKDIVNKDFIEMINQANHLNTNHSKMFQDFLDTNQQMLIKVGDLVEVDKNIYNILKKEQNNSITHQDSTGHTQVFTNDSSKKNKSVLSYAIRQEISDFVEDEKENLINMLKVEVLSDIQKQNNDTSFTQKEIGHLNDPTSLNSMPFSNFVNICTVFTSFFIIFFLFYKLYNRTRRFYPRASSTSTQVIPNNLELSEA